MNPTTNTLSVAKRGLVRIRFTQVDDVGPLRAGMDDVSLEEVGSR